MSLGSAPLRGALGACLLAGTAPAAAGGFALIEQGASGLGNAYAGAAAVSADASTIWFNPAGMSELPGREFAAALHAIRADNRFEDRGSTLNSALGGDAVSGPADASPGTTAITPNLFFSSPSGDRLHYGIGIGVPFGSSTEYGDDWRGRYTSTDSGVSVFDINPSIAWRLSDTVRLGAGISLQYLDAELESAIDSGAVCLSIYAETSPATCVNRGLVPGNRAQDSSARITGDSTAVTFNLGALFVPNDSSRIGIAYRHGAEHELDGDADFSVDEDLAAVIAAVPPASARFTDRGSKASIELPAQLMLSAAHRATDRLELLVDATWTGWSSFEELRVRFDGDTTGEGDSVSRQEWEDVWRYSAGLNWRQNDALLLRAGVAFDEEPIPSPQRRTARIPGNDRTWIAFGLNYAFGSQASLDVGYAHLFLDETPIDNANEETAGGQTLRGVYDPAVDILSAQFNWQFR